MATVWDLHKHLGSIPLHRILLDPLPGTATEKDVLELMAREDRLCELIDGVLVEKTMATYESRIAIVIAYFIEVFLEHHDLGIVLGADGMLRLFPGQVRIPDVSFISWDQLPNREFPPEAIASIHPNLAVEVLSEDNTEEEITRKIREYFKAGTALVWCVDPRDQAVRVYTSPRRSTLVTKDEKLNGGKVLQRFVLPVAKIFARAGRWRGR